MLRSVETQFRAGPSGLRVTTRLPGDRRATTGTLTLRLAPGKPVIEAVVATPGTPLWALRPSDLTVSRVGSVLSAGQDDATRARWADRLDRAAEAVGRLGVPGSEGWSGGLVVEVPSDDAAFEALTGSSATTASAITTCAAGTPRVVVSPRSFSLDAGWLDATLVHETVHVATDSACTGGGLGWVVEGLAESVAAPDRPGDSRRNRGLVRSHLRGHGIPDALPDRLETTTDYALAQLAVDQVRARGKGSAGDFLGRALREPAAVTPSELRRATRWYRAALERLAG